MSNPWIAALLVFCVNLPFGYWRAGVRRFSLPWVLAVHLPVPLVAGVRFMSHTGYQFATFSLLGGAFFAGQYLGGKLRHGGGGAAPGTPRGGLGDEHEEG